MAHWLRLTQICTKKKKKRKKEKKLSASHSVSGSPILCAAYLDAHEYKKG